MHCYTPGLGSSPVARHYWGNHCYFLFLEVLRCFSSLRSPPYLGKDSRPSACWVVPFGNPRIKGHLHLPEAYRSLSRPSSPPRAKASTRRPNLLSPIIECLPAASTVCLACGEPFDSLILSAVIESFVHVKKTYAELSFFHFD